MPRLVRASIFTVNAPKNRQPAIECSSTRALKVWNPSAYTQCTTTGTVKMNAIRPDQRCRPLIQDGAVTPRTFPYMTREEPTWTIVNTIATQAVPPARYEPTEAASVLRRRAPRWLLPTALGVAVLIAAGIMIAVFALKGSPPPPSFLPGETGSPPRRPRSYRPPPRVDPPSSTRVWPVTQLAASDSRNATAPATSSGTPRRLSG